MTATNGTYEQPPAPASASAAEPAEPAAAQTTYGFGTLAVHAGSPHDPATGAVIEPISLSTTFKQSAVGKPVGIYEYSRSSNPNRDNFEAAVAALEKAKYALAFASGSATTAVILQSLPQGAHVVSVSDVYGGTHRYFTKVANAHGVEVTFTNEIEVDIKDFIRENTKLVWIETPSNPTLKLVNIRAVADEAHKLGITVVVDNTFLSPYIQNPLTLGADIVVHSVTKYINGHSDVVMGVAALNDDALHARLVFLQNAIGAVPSAFDSWLAHRGLKTLHLRARQASTNAAAIAHALESSPHVVSVNYPGLDSHPHRAVALKQHREGMGGGMLSFRIRGGALAAERFCQATKIFTLAESLGGVESLVEVPAAMTHAGIPQDKREAVGIYDDLVRVSCGVEEADDLVDDVLRGLEEAVRFAKGASVTNGSSNGVNGVNGH
jgi:cystathionine gamma-lyase